MEELVLQGYRQAGAVYCLSLFLLGDIEIPQQGRASPSHYLVVEVHDCTDLGRYFLHLIQAEVSRIFADADFGVIWLDDRQPFYVVSDKPYEARVYIRSHLSMSFECHEDNMAYVPTDRGESPGPVVYISRESVEEKIAFKKSNPPPVLARAIGRVMAHELSHRFLQYCGHTRQGILKKSLSRNELTQPAAKGFFFTKEQIRFIRSYAPTLDEARVMFSVESKE